MRIILSGIAMALAGAAHAGPAVDEFKAEYAISYFGLKIARSSFVSRMDGRNFSISGSFSSAGLAAIIAPTSGTTETQGIIEATGAKPTRYSLNYTTDGKVGRTDIVYAKGDIVRYANKPESKKPKPANYVPVTPEKLKSAFDPLTATMISATSPAAVCARTLRVFDGATRADFVLSPAGETRFNAGDASGVAVRCKARFQPVAGYREGSKDIDYMRKKATIEIAFARTGIDEVWAPVAVTLGSQVGTFKLYATRFGG